MSNKRRNTSSPDCEGLPRKRRASPSTQSSFTEDEDYVHPTSHPQIDATTGQASAFPGLNASDDNFYGPAANGIDYLRMVRSEAHGIPQLLTSQTQVEGFEENRLGENNFDDRIGGYYEDGAYTAKPQLEMREESGSFKLAQQRYYESLLKHFALVRATVRCVPPLDLVQRLSHSRSISFPGDSKAAIRQWEQQITTYDPDPVQIACMDNDSVLESLRLLGRNLEDMLSTEDKYSIRRIGAWLWSLLGKCPDRGVLASEEMSDLRVLARHAAEIMLSLDEVTDRERVMQDEKFGGSLSDGDGALSEEIKQAKKRLEGVGDIGKVLGEIGTNGTNDQQLEQQELSALEITEVKRAILDMVITVVGDVYGQRDLLELRIPWTAQVAQG